MTFWDFLIIYLSLGAPFGVHHLVNTPKPTGINSFSLVMFAFLLWPIYAVQSVFKHFDKQSLYRNPDHNEQLIERLEILNQQFLLKAKLSHRKIAQRAEQTLERYCELSLASITTAQYSKQYSEFLAVSGHPKPTLGAKCLNRRNEKIINQHLNDARNQLKNALKDTSEPRQNVIDIVKKIAGLFGDLYFDEAFPPNLETVKMPYDIAHKQQTLAPTLLD